MEIVKQVAHVYRTEREELEADLFKHLLELKTTRQREVRNWKSFLARSLYNAANNFVRDERHRRRKSRSLAAEDEGEDKLSLVQVLAAPPEPVDLRIDVASLWREMAPELRDLWALLLEEAGNTSAVAKRLGRPRKTVEYWIQKLRRFLKRRGF